MVALLSKCAWVRSTEQRLLLSGDGLLAGPRAAFVVDLRPGLSEVILRLDGAAGEQAAQIVDAVGTV
jgi:hypothetical protein